MFGVTWKLIVALCFLNLRVEANPSGSQKKKIASEINSRQLSRSAHRTPNFTNPEFFVYLLFEYFFQIKVLN